MLKHPNGKQRVHTCLNHLFCDNMLQVLRILSIKYKLKIYFITKLVNQPVAMNILVKTAPRKGSYMYK